MDPVTFAAGIVVGGLATFSVLALRQVEESWRPEPVRPALARCEDCGGACHVSRTGRCDRCGSASVWIAGAHS